MEYADYHSRVICSCPAIATVYKGRRRRLTEAEVLATIATGCGGAGLCASCTVPATWQSGRLGWAVGEYLDGGGSTATLHAVILGPTTSRLSLVRFNKCLKRCSFTITKFCRLQ